jgi:hypothetical protein
MIVTYKKEEWEVITQRSHGILAVQFAFHWKIKNRPNRWIETLLAIAEHDDAEIELDGEELLTPSGGPLNYSMKIFNKFHCQRLSMLTMTKSQYIALLTSLHMEFLYRKQSTSNKEAFHFLQKQKKIRSSLQTTLGIKKGELEKIYALLEWCDAFSLILCQGQIPPENRSVEISTGPNHVPYQLFQIAAGILVVKPWPFEQNSFNVHFESRCLEQIKFSDSAEFRKAFTDCAVKETIWKIRKETRNYKKRDKVTT